MFVFLVLAKVAMANAGSLSVQSRVAGGQEASPGQFPYHVAVESENNLFCGGSILAPSFVLTAAHCISTNVGILVVAGAHNIFDIFESDQQMRDVDKFFKHESYGYAEKSHDIALLHLKTPFVLNKRVQSIALPQRNQAANRFVNSTAVLSGWGRIPSQSTPGIPAKLHFVELLVAANEICDVLDGFDRSSHICTSGKDSKGPCKGDSGGGLVLTEPGRRPVIIGLASLHPTVGCDLSLPAAFTRITSYSVWIETGMKKLSGGG